jgi:hypothetical protein
VGGGNQGDRNSLVGLTSQLCSSEGTDREAFLPTCDVFTLLGRGAWSILHHVTRRLLSPVSRHGCGGIRRRRDHGLQLNLRRPMLNSYQSLIDRAIVMAAKDTAKLSAKFQISIPKAIRTARRWQAGQVFAASKLSLPLRKLP